MSDTSFMKGIFVLDVETAGHEDRIPFVPVPTAPTLETAPKTLALPEAPVAVTEDQAPKRCKTSEAKATWVSERIAGDQAKYADRIAKLEAAREEWLMGKQMVAAEKYQGLLAKMALDVDLCQIVAIGWQVSITHDGGLSTVAIGADGEEEEAAALRDFWRAWTQFGSRMCGFNIIGFDLPIIMRRSWALDVQFAPINLRRYSTEHVIDLMQLFYGWGQYPGPKYRGLKTLAEMYGIPIPMPDVDGSMVAGMTKAEREEYCLSDVDVTWKLARRLHGAYWQ